MKQFFSDIWVKRCVSVFNLIYLAVVAIMTYATFEYQLVFNEGMQTSFFIMYSVAGLVFMLLLIYTKERLVTKIINVVMLPLVFCLLILNINNWLLFAVPLVVALVGFFTCNTNPTSKVILGTIYLLIYVLGIIAYIVLTIIMPGNANETKLSPDMDKKSSVYALYENSMDKIAQVTSDKNTVSPDGKLQFYIVDCQDNSIAGAVKIYVVPCNEDKTLKFFTLKQKGIRKTVSTKGTRGVVPEVGWTDNNQLQFRLSDTDKLNVTTIEEMPAKQYFEFIGIYS